jgi:O-antigen/teichoic acid export membrane protein
MRNTSRAGAFTGRVVVTFGTQVIGAGIAIVNGILLARLLGPAAKGDYYLLILVPSTVMSLTLLGLPQAFGFFAARGKTRGIVAKSVLMTVILASAGFVGTLVFLPLLRETVLRGLGVDKIIFAVLALPLALGAAFSTAIIMGRQAVGWYAAVNLAAPIATTFLIIGILGGLGPSVNGAIAVYLIALAVQTVGFWLGARRVSAANDRAEAVSYRELLRYALPFYVANLPVHFSYRIDGYLIAWLIAGPSAPLGFYSLSVALAELIFFFPDAVSILFFPHVAGATREESDRQVVEVSRITVLISAAVAPLLIPAAAITIWVFLPAFGPALPPFLVLLPGVVALSPSKIVAGYMTGINRPGVRTVVSFTTLAANVVANVILIPRFGIVGAAAASLVSYSFSAFLNTAIAARLTHARVRDFWIPSVSDVRFMVATIAGLVRRLRDRFAGVPDRLDA